MARYLFRLLIIAFFLLWLLPGKTYAQEWAPTGAKWYYTAPYTGYCLMMESMGDTLIQSKNCKILELRFPNYDNYVWSHEYLHQSGDSIFYYNYYHESFHLFYNFAAQEGDTITVHENTFKPTEGFYDPYYYWDDSINYFKYLVVEIDSILVSGNWLKQQEVIYARKESESPAIGFPLGYLLGKMGSELYFFGRTNYFLTGEDYVGILRCYQDEVLNYTSPEWAGPCDDEIVSLQENRESGNIQLYPNPAFDNSFFIEATSPIEQITIFNMQGYSVFINHPGLNTVQVDIGFLSKGIYQVQLTLSNGKIITKILSKL